MSNERTPVEILEYYKDYEPPLNAKAVVERLLRYVPPRCLAGLDCIVLTNTKALPRNYRRGKTWSRRRKVKIAETRGCYHPKVGSRQARIDSYVNNIAMYESRMFRVIPFLRDTTLADVLYHEIGHHIHYTIRPEHHEREAVAEKWEAQLMKNLIHKGYWYLLPLLRLNKRITQSKWFQKRFPKPAGL